MAGSTRSSNKPEGAAVVRLRPSRKCPICGKPSAQATYPFCSKRCADIDLNRWLSGSYAIPAVEEESGELGEGDDGES